MMACGLQGCPTDSCSDGPMTTPVVSPFQSPLAPSTSFKAIASFRLSPGQSLAGESPKAGDAAATAAALQTSTSAAAVVAAAAGDASDPDDAAQLMAQKEVELQELRQQLGQTTDDLKRNLTVGSAHSLGWCPGPACLLSRHCRPATSDQPGASPGRKPNTIALCCRF